ncbi:TPA: oligosaccharide flippase family protein [Klebsiella pneumoniae]|nr:oligosaccharide flippase family protein [Klebsiella pneumoniae]
MVSIKFVRNFASLGTMQVINYIVPILLTPFLVMKIGIANVGIIATSMAVATYIQLFIDYGFNLTATREIAKDGYNDFNASKITSAVYNIKLLLSFISLVFICLLAVFVPYFRECFWVLFFSFLLIVTQSFFPVWHFQGAERMQYIGLCNSIPRIISAILILIFVKKPSDAWMVQFILFIGSFFALLMAIFILISRFNYKYYFSHDEIRKQFKVGKSIFIARIASGLYKNFNVLILGYCATPSAVGVYSIAEKILRSMQMVQNVVGDVLYPFFSKNTMSSKDFFKIQIKKYKLILVSVYLIASAVIYLFSDYIAYILAHSARADVSLSMKIMSFAFFFGGMNYIYAILGLTSSGYSGYFSKCVVITGFFNVIVASVLSYQYSFIGTSIALVTSEFFLLAIVLFYSKKVGIV